jgi:acyl carrier protein
MRMSSAPDRSQILHRLQNLVSGRVPIDPKSLLPDAQLVDIGLDSFSLIELVFLAEEEFNIKIPIEGLKVTTVGDVLDVIAQRVERTAAA